MEVQMQHTTEHLEVLPRDGTAYSGWSTAWSGETVTNYVNGTNIGTSRVSAYKLPRSCCKVNGGSYNDSEGAGGTYLVYVNTLDIL